MARRLVPFVLIALLLAVVAVLVVRAQQTPSAARAASGDTGRYQIVIDPQMRADTFLLDTQTGRIWKPVEHGYLEGNPVVWQFQERVDNDAQLVAWTKQFSSKKSN